MYLRTASDCFRYKRPVWVAPSPSTLLLPADQTRGQTWPLILHKLHPSTRRRRRFTSVPPPTRVKHSPTMMLKLRLPGVDPRTVHTLSAEQVAQVPAEFLSFLHKHGQVEDLGDIKIISVQEDRHNFTILSVAGWLANGSLDHGELQVEQLERKSDHTPVAYDPSTHAQDVRFVTTFETHAQFLRRLRLYTFSLSFDMKDLQEYLCKTIRTEYPIYEAELLALLTTFFEGAGDLPRLEPTLASFISERMLCLRGMLLANKTVLPLLCKAIGAKDQFLALADRADHFTLALALNELRKGIGKVGETHVLLDTFIERNHVSENAVQPTQPVPLLTPATLGKRKRGGSFSAQAQAEPAGSSVATAAKIVSGNHSNNAAGDGRVHVGSSNNTRERRPHPGQSLWVKKKTYSSGPRQVLRVARPNLDNEYWSITTTQWAELSDLQKRRVTHASNICETEAGVVAPERCSACAELGLVCEVYTDDDLHRKLGKTCARCLISGAKCSHTAASKPGVVDED